MDRFGSMFYEPLTVLGFAAACTSRIRLGTTVLILPYRNPVVTAKSALDPGCAVGGTVTAGMAVGWTEDEFNALGVPFRERGALSDEYIAAFKALWTQETPSFHRATTCALSTSPSSPSRCRSRTSRSGSVATASAPFAALWPWAMAGIRRARCRTMSRLVWPMCERSAPSVDATPRHCWSRYVEPLKFYEAAEASVRRRPFLGSTQRSSTTSATIVMLASILMLDTFYSAPELEHETVEACSRPSSASPPMSCPKSSLEWWVLRDESR